MPYNIAAFVRGWRNKNKSERFKDVFSITSFQLNQWYRAY